MIEKKVEEYAREWMYERYNMAKKFVCVDMIL